MNNGVENAGTTALAESPSEHAIETVERVLIAAREMLGMDVAFVAEFDDERMLFRAFGGDAESFGWEEGASVPLEDTYCRRLVEGRLPSAVPDARGDERVKDLDMTREAGIGAYVGVPLQFSDGRLYGTLAALSHSMSSTRIWASSSTRAWCRRSWTSCKSSTFCRPRRGSA
jgi:hypothetical protein